MPKTIQHIQHIQHFSRKKLFFWRALTNIFNIFNISAEKSIFCSKRALSAEIIQTYPQKRLPQGKCWIVGFFWTEGRRLTSARNHSTYSTYSTVQQKEAHFSEATSEQIQHIQHFSRKDPKQSKKGLILQFWAPLFKKRPGSAEWSLLFLENKKGPKIRVSDFVYADFWPFFEKNTIK